MIKNDSTKDKNMSDNKEDIKGIAQSGANEGYSELANICSNWGDFTKTFYSSVFLISNIICNLDGIEIVEGNKIYSLKSTADSVEFVFEKIRECVDAIIVKKGRKTFNDLA